MKVRLPLPHGYAVTLEALAGLVVLQLTQPGPRLQTVTLTTEQSAQLIDLLGLVAVTAEEQAVELDTMVALLELRHRKPQLFAGEAREALEDLVIPAYLRPLQ